MPGSGGGLGPLPTGDETVPMIPGHVIECADEHAADTERLRRLHPKVLQALTEAGLLRGWVAAEYGGRGASVSEVLAEIEALSRADGAAGWCVMIANTTALTSHHLPAVWAREIYADPAGCSGGFGMPSGTATLVDGGLSVSGRWPWGSGTSHCSWIGAGARVVDGRGEPAQTADGAATPFVFFEPQQVELLDTWYAAGLKGTASTDYSAAGAFVPEGRWVQLVGGAPLIDSALARFPFFSALACGVAAVLVGLGARACDELVLLADKRPTGSSRSLAERAPVQADLAQAQAHVAGARAYLHDVVGEATAAVASGSSAGSETRASLRLAASAAAHSSLAAVDLCFHAAGGSAVFDSHPLQRVFRDAHVAISHGMITRRTFEPIGRLRFGLDTSTALF